MISAHPGVYYVQMVNKMTKKIIVLFLLLLTVKIAAAALVYSETDSVLAAVNGDPITLSEILPAVREKELQLRSAYSGKVLEQEILKLRFRAVEELADQKLIVADFHSKKLAIPPQEVENELDRLGAHIGCHSRRELEERVKRSGITFAKFREKIRNRMIVQVMRRREYLLAGTPTPAEVYQRFKTEEKQLSFPGNVELALLKFAKNDSSNIKNVGKSLSKNPSQWDQFAQLYAVVPGTNGSIGSIELDKLRPEFAKAMQEIKEGKIYSGVETADGVYFIKILKYQPSRKAIFREHAEAIKKKMESENYRQCCAEYARRLRDGAVIEYFFPIPEGVNKK